MTSWLDTFETDHHLGNGMADGRHSTPSHTRRHEIGAMPSLDLLGELLANSKAPVRTPAQIAAEALRMDHMQRFDRSHPCITVQYLDGADVVRAACYSEESAAAMVIAFEGQFLDENRSPLIDAAIDRLEAADRNLFAAIAKL